MVISDLQYLESVESSAIVGGGKKYKPKYGKGGGFNLAINVAVVKITQVAVGGGKYSSIKQEADVDIDF